MNIKFSQRLLSIGKAAFFSFLLLCSTTFINAQTVTFAQFVELNGTNDFIFTNNGSNATFQTIPNGSPILFRYQNLPGLAPELQGEQRAHIFVTSTTTAPVSITGNRIVQPFNQTFTIRIIRDTPTSMGVGSGSRTNLLTAIVTPAPDNPVLAGDTGGESAGFTASTPNQNIVYNSDFITFPTLSTSRNLALSFSSVTPALALGTGGFMRSFTAAGTGTFASNPGPTSSTPPTSAGVVISGRVLAANGRGSANTRVKLTRADGETYFAMTNSFGYYKFYDITVGETVVVTVKSKRYVYEPKVLNVGEEITGLDFIPVN